MEEPGREKIKENPETDIEKEREIEDYRNQFEQAMIKIEDQEDFQAFKNAKAEIDQEF